MNYLTIDFETANSSPTSACSLGIVVVREGRIKEKLHYLINPNEEFLDYNISIHKITKEDVADAPSFDELWVELFSLFDNSLVYAHNAGFDLGVLKANIEKYNLDVPKIKWGCTLKIARKLWPTEMINHKLGTIASFLELEHNHHNALSDAIACHEIIKRGLRMMQVDTSVELYDILALRYGQYNPERFYGSYNKYRNNKKVEIIEKKQITNKVFFLEGKPKTLTKKELGNNLTSYGAYIEKNINLSLDYFVVLGNAKKSSMDKLKGLNDRLGKIKIINEEDVLKLLE